MRRPILALTLPVLLAMAAPAAAATPAPGKWRGSAGNTQVVLEVAGKAVTSGKIAIGDSFCKRFEVTLSTQILPRMKIDAKGRFGGSRTKHKGRLFYAIKGRFKNGAATGTIRWFDRDGACDVGTVPFSAAPRAPFAL